MRTHAAADTTRSPVRTPRTATRAMAPTRAATATTAAPTWSWLTIDAGTSGGSFGATPATTVAAPDTPTNQARTRLEVPSRVATARAAPTTSRPLATRAARTSHAHGCPSDASRLTVSAPAS